MLFDQVGETEDQAPSLRSRHFSPGPVFESGARSFDGAIDVGGIGFGNLANFLAGGWIDGRESPAGFARDPTVIDQKFRSGDSDGAGLGGWHDSGQG
jgi:hypothetical protein